MVFQPGQSYYVLTPSEYADLLALAEEFELLDAFQNDFEQADDNNYYVITSSSKLTSEELAFLDDNGFMNIFNYIKSTQSTSPL